MTDAQNQPKTQAPAGWYLDPSGAPVMRWWDGMIWTAQMTPMAAPTPIATPAPPQKVVEQRNPYGSASAVLAVVALLIPFNTALLLQPWNVVTLGFVAAGVAIWLGMLGLKRSREIQVGRTASAFGVAAGIAAVLLVAFYVFGNSWVLFS